MDKTGRFVKDAKDSWELISNIIKIVKAIRSTLFARDENKIAALHMMSM